MKRYLTLGLLLAFASTARAATYKREFEQFRSTAPSGPASFFLVATGTVFLSEILVTSGVPNSTFRFFNGTSPVTITSTGPVYDTQSSGSWFPVNQWLTNGFMFTTTGNSILDVKWDWYLTAPVGQNTKGRY